MATGNRAFGSVVRELLSLRIDPDASSAEVKARAEAKMVDIEAKIRTQERIEDTLVSITAACDGCAPVDACPILDALDAEENLEEDVSESEIRRNHHGR